jgi:hypothetical protein
MNMHRDSPFKKSKITKLSLESKKTKVDFKSIVVFFILVLLLFFNLVRGCMVILFY